MTIAFDEAFKLARKRPLPRDILQRLAVFESKIDVDEIEDFQWVYENIHLEIDKVGSGVA